MDRFRCGHEKTVENIESCGGTRTACRTCRRARARTPENRAKGAEQMRRFRAGIKKTPENANAQKMHCSKGHEFTEKNTYVFRGWRQCITCRYARTRAYYHQKRANGGEHTEEQWQAMCSAADYACAHCHQCVKLTRDHIIPVSKGGSNDITNIQPLCRACNASKKDHLVLEGV